MNKIALITTILSLSLTTKALVTVGDDSLYAGYVRGDNYVGANHKAELKSIAVNTTNFTKKDIEALIECEMKSLGGENVAFILRADASGVKDAVCAPAPAKQFRKAWQFLLQLNGK